MSTASPRAAAPARGGSPLRRLWLVWLLAIVAVQICGLAAAQRPVVIVDARVAWADAVLADGGVVYGLAVEEVVHGFSPGSLLAARASTGSEELGRFLEMRPGGLVRVELRAMADGLYELVNAHDLPRPAEHRGGSTSTPPGLLGEPDYEQHLPHPTRAVPRRVRSAAEDTSFEQQVAELVNEQRWSYDQHPPAGPDHLPPLKRVTELNNSADGHSFNMADRDFFAHCDLDTLKSPFVRMNDAGYSFNAAGENIAAGYNTPAEAMASWMSSSGHRSNIMDMDDGVADGDNFGFREIGLGFHFQSGDQGNIRRDLLPNTFPGPDCVADSFNNGPYSEYWTQNFGRRNSVYPVVINREASSTTSQTVTLYVYGAGFANQMRFSNNNTDWASQPWEPYSTAKTWTLSAGGGDKQVWAQLDTSDAGSDPNHTASDTIYYDAACGTTTLDGQTLSGSYQDCLIIAEDSEVIGDTTFLADTVRLRDGFVVANGVEFRVAPQP